jgi:hypothetical protein
MDATSIKMASPSFEGIPTEIAIQIATEMWLAVNYTGPWSRNGSGKDVLCTRFVSSK